MTTASHEPEGDLDLDAIIQAATEGVAIPEQTPEQRLERAGVRLLNVADMLDEPPPAYDWLWDGYLERGEVTWLTGKGKTGKSLVALFLAAACLEGRPFLERDTKRVRRVAYIDGENREATVRRRLHACGLGRDLAGSLVYASARGLDLGTPHGLDALSILAEDADLVVLDSLVALHTADENSAGEVRQLVTAIRGAIERAGSTALGLAHEKHGGGLRGSTDWTNAVDRVLALSKDESGYRTLKPGDVRDGDENVPPLVFRFAAEGGRVVIHTTGTRGGRPTADRADLAGRIADYLAEHPHESKRATARALGTTHDSRPFRDAWEQAKSGAETVGPPSGAETVGPGGAMADMDAGNTLFFPMATGDSGGAETMGPERGHGWGRNGGGALKGPPHNGPTAPGDPETDTGSDPADEIWGEG